jgi:glycosyltransferase involved in cell wall biosynthesis
MGGPAHHVGLLTARLDPERYETLVFHGDCPPGEASLSDVVRREGTVVRRVPGLGPRLRPHDDALALAHLVRVVGRLRPDIVHTHTAKAGLLARLAVVLARGPRPVVVHTYHGHVLEGYFGPIRNCIYRELERRLSEVSDALVAVSSATVDDLVRLQIAARSKFQVIPIGLDLEPFLQLDEGAGAGFRQEVRAAPDEILLTFVGRLAAIKRGDLMLRAFAHAVELGAPVRLAVVGDGERRGALERLAGELGLGGRVAFVGYRADMPTVASASDIGLLTSDNEGTPVSLIEAAAAGTPAIATAVGGVPDVVTSESGLLLARGDFRGVGRAIADLAAEPARRAEMGRNARVHVRKRFSAERLVEDVDRLYRELIARGRDLPAGHAGRDNSKPL